MECTPIVNSANGFIKIEEYMNRLWFATVITLIAIFTTSAYAQPDTAWTKLYGGPLDDYLFGVVATIDNGAGLFVQQTVSADSDYVGILKLEANGDSSWTCVLPWPTAGRSGIGYHDDVMTVMNQMYEIIEILWISREGQILRRSTELRPYANLWREFIDLGMSGFLLRGDGDIPGYRPVVLRLDANGDSLWTHEIESEYEIRGDQAIPLHDGGVALLTHFGINSQYDIRLIRYDRQGEVVLDRNYGGEGSSDPIRIWENDDGSFTMLAQWLERDSLCFLQLNEAGDLLSTSRSVSPTRYGITSALAIRLSDGTFLVWSKGEEWITWVTADGESLWRNTNMGAPFTVTELANGGVFLASVESDHYRGRFRSDDFWLMCLDFPPAAVEDETIVPNKSILLSAYPNPFNSSAVIEYNIDRPGFVKLGVYDMAGRLVERPFSQLSHTSSGKFVWDASELPAGKYSIVLTSPAGNAVRGVTLVK